MIRGGDGYHGGAGILSASPNGAITIVNTGEIAGGRGDVGGSHVAWRAPSGAPYVSSLVYYDNLIYMVGDVGVLTVVDAATGERTHQERIGGVYSASPVAADGKIYLTNEEGGTTVLAASTTAKKLATNQIEGRTLASLATAGRAILLRSDKHLYRIEVGTR